MSGDGSGLSGSGAWRGVAGVREVRGRGGKWREGSVVKREGQNAGAAVEHTPAVPALVGHWDRRIAAS